MVTTTGDEQKPLWREHLTLLVTAATLVVFLARVVIVAHADPTTALALLQQSEPGTALLGLAATVGTPVLFAIGAILFGGFTEMRWRREHRLPRGMAVGFIATAMP